MNAFQYRRPQTLSEAVDLIAQNVDASVLAGGQSLLAAMRLGLSSPSELIDLQDIDSLKAISVDLKARTLTIGAMAAHASIAASAQVQAFCPMLAKLAGGIADQQIRERGTIGGSIANNDPAACWPCGLLALDAVIVTTLREIPAADFFLGMFSTALEAGEIITAVRFSDLNNGAESLGHTANSRYVKFEQPASRFAIVGVAVARLGGSDTRVSVTGLGNGVMRFAAAEQCLNQRFEVEAISQCKLEPDVALGDLHASAEYRAHLAAVLTRRAVGAMVAEGKTAE